MNTWDTGTSTRRKIDYIKSETSKTVGIYISCCHVRYFCE